MITIVLVEPEHPGNVGAIARVMKNFDFNKLILINPKCNHLCAEAKNRAKWANDVLSKAKVSEFSNLKRFDCVVGTTAIVGTDYNIPRSPLTPEELAKKVSGNCALVFGREGTGLTKKEIAECDFIVTIPSSSKYPTLNISHSVSIVLYELYKKTGENRIEKKIQMASSKEKEVILDKVDNILGKMNFSTPSKIKTQKFLWKRIVGKSMLTKREAFALIGFLRKLE